MLGCPGDAKSQNLGTDIFANHPSLALALDDDLFP
ncbi:uncharacterized protein METZ01_LOCUS261102, partial [marine metagenome]